MKAHSSPFNSQVLLGTYIYQSPMRKAIEVLFSAIQLLLDSCLVCVIIYRMSPFLYYHLNFFFYLRADCSLHIFSNVHITIIPLPHSRSFHPHERYFLHVTLNISLFSVPAFKSSHTSHKTSLHSLHRPLLQTSSSAFRSLIRSPFPSHYPPGWQ